MARPSAPIASRPARKKSPGSTAASKRSRRFQPPPEPIEIQTTDDDEAELELKEVPAAGSASMQAGDQDDDLELEEVDVSANGPPDEGQNSLYATVHEGQDESNGEGPQDSTAPIVFHDGKGQPKAAAGISLTFAESEQSTPSKKAAKGQRLTAVTPRDRAARIDGHKLHVIALLAHAKLRNEWINDESLRDHLYNMAPAPLRQKLRGIHPKKVESQRERVRMFEAFMGELVRWWAVRFYLDPDQSAAGAIRQPNSDMLSGAFPRVGRRVDGWVVESERDRTKRHEQEQKGNDSRRRRKGGKKIIRRPLPSVHSKAEEITIFPPGSDPMSRPALLRLLPAPEPIAEPADLLEAAKARSGSRETSAQLFCGLCRALGIPSRLVISPQVAAWSIGASKVAQSAGALDIEDRKAAKKQNGKRQKGKIAQSSARFALKGTDDDTSEEDGFSDGMNLSKTNTPPPQTQTRRNIAGGLNKSKGGSESRPVSIASSSLSPPPHSEVSGSGSRGRRGRADSPAEDSAAGSSRPKKKSKTEKDEDYRDDKWKGLEAPLEVDYQPKLRVSKPAPAKETALESQTFDDVDPIDLTSPPVMWVEVFSKPFQRWLTVDTIRARVTATGSRQMEPASSDRANKLIYVMAFEEDGYARDVTARYTKTLYSRISRMRPPPSKKGGEWWESVVQAMHRPQRLERDAVEDAELQEAASKEPMPNSVGGFKDHPVYALERHLKRDEALHPYIQIGTFQGIPVFHRKNVLSLRSARQWYNEGREIEIGQEALKWVKTRGYTINSRRAEEQARAEGAEEPQEGLYARFQTRLYTPPPVEDGIVPKNHFGNIDLFVPSMLPEGGAHIPHNGTAKVAKKLGVSYAEAIIGFEFRKHRSMPKLLGIVVPEEHEEAVLDAYWASEHAAAEKELNRQQERALRHWRKLLNALRIAKRMKEQYGQEDAVATDGGVDRNGEARAQQGGGFMDEDEDEDEGAEANRFEVGPASSSKSSTPPPEKSKMTLKLEKYGAARANTGAAQRDDLSDEDSDAEGRASSVDQAEAGAASQPVQDTDSRGMPMNAPGAIVEPEKIISLADLAQQGHSRPASDTEHDEANGSVNPSKKRRKIVLRRSAKPQASSVAQQPSSNTRPRRQRKSASGSEQATQSQTPAEETSSHRRRSTRRAATAARGAFVDAEDSDEDLDD